MPWAEILSRMGSTSLLRNSSGGRSSSTLDGLWLQSAECGADGDQAAGRRDHRSTDLGPVPMRGVAHEEDAGQHAAQMRRVGNVVHRNAIPAGQHGAEEQQELGPHVHRDDEEEQEHQGTFRVEDGKGSHQAKRAGRRADRRGGKRSAQADWEKCSARAPARTWNIPPTTPLEKYRVRKRRCPAQTQLRGQR